MFYFDQFKKNVPTFYFWLIQEVSEIIKDIILY